MEEDEFRLMKRYGQESYKTGNSSSVHSLLLKAKFSNTALFIFKKFL